MEQDRRDSHGDGRVSGIGLVIPLEDANDHFVAALRQAVAEPLIAAGFGLFTRVVEDAEGERDLYCRWAGTDGIAGVLLLGGHDDAARIALLRELGLAFTAVISSLDAGDFPAVVIDTAESSAVVSRFLADRQHARTVYITASLESVPAQGWESMSIEQPEVIHSGGSPENALAAAMSALKSGPATLLFDSDVHAHTVLTGLIASGRRVPEDAAVISWTDSALCRSSAPAITAVNRRGSEIGDLLGRRMLATIAGGSSTHDRAPAPFIVSRGSA